MRIGNPLQDEGAAFRLLLLTIAALALIVVAARISTALGVVVLALELGWVTRLGWHAFRRRSAPPPVGTSGDDPADDARDL